jgi:hypothetical protein
MIETIAVRAAHRRKYNHSIQCFRSWPISGVARPLIEVRSVEHSGLDLLTWSSSHLDPTLTSEPLVLTGLFVRHSGHMKVFWMGVEFCSLL